MSTSLLQQSVPGKPPHHPFVFLKRETLIGGFPLGDMAFQQALLLLCQLLVTLSAAAEPARIHEARQGGPISIQPVTVQIGRAHV